MLKPLYQSAAELEVRGVVQREGADLLGIPRRSYERILTRPEVKEEIERLREIGVTDTMADVAIRRALLATLPNGSVDHKTRIAAAKMQAELPRIVPASELRPPICFTVELVEYEDAVHGKILISADGTWVRDMNPPASKPDAPVPGTPGAPALSSFSPKM